MLKDVKQSISEDLKERIVYQYNYSYNITKMGNTSYYTEVE
jgi:hypothetical protein